MRSFRRCSDKELLNRLAKLVKQEHTLTLEILPHLIEVENRKIYRALGYSSMFVYCTDCLGYSESSAQRRICSARAIRRCPEAYDYLKSGHVNLATLALSWRFLTPGLLREIRGKSYRQVRTIVSRFNPMLKHRDITRPVVVRKPIEVPGERQPARALNGSCGLAPAVDGQSGPELGDFSLRRGGKKLTTDTRQNENGPPMGDEESTPELKMKTFVMHQVNCLVDNHVMLMLDRCKELLSGKHPCGIDYNTLMLELAQTWLEKHDPVQRAERRDKRKNKTHPQTSVTGETSRHICPATRDTVYNRDGGQCTYVGSNGKRCNSTWDLEIHHDVTPFSRGGSHSIANLRLLCATHNRLDAEKVIGESHMKKFKRKIE